MVDCASIVFGILGAKELKALPELHVETLALFGALNRFFFGYIFLQLLLVPSGFLLDSFLTLCLYIVTKACIQNIGS